MLRCFSALARIETLIKRGPLTTERILRYRQRYATKIWALMKASWLLMSFQVAPAPRGPRRSILLPTAASAGRAVS